MRLRITDRREANRIVSNPPPDLAAVVSIFTPPKSRLAAWEANDGLDGTFPVEGFDEFGGHKISLSFDDATQNEDGIFAPEREDIERFLRWAETVPYPAPGTMLVHCRAGISRSTACALAFLSLKHGPGSEQKCIQDVTLVQPEAWFNDTIVALADDILGRNGALVLAVQEWKAAVKVSSMY